MRWWGWRALTLLPEDRLGLGPVDLLVKRPQTLLTMRWRAMGDRSRSRPGLLSLLHLTVSPRLTPSPTYVPVLAAAHRRPLIVTARAQTQR